MNDQIIVTLKKKKKKPSQANFYSLLVEYQLEHTLCKAVLAALYKIECNTQCKIQQLVSLVSQLIDVFQFILYLSKCVHPNKT